MLKEAVSTFTFSTVVSLTGSNPMDLSVMRSLQSLKNAIFIYLDVHLDDIVKRLGEMKVDRIVGASDACCGTSNPGVHLVSAPNRTRTHPTASNCTHQPSAFRSIIVYDRVNLL